MLLKRKTPLVRGLLRNIVKVIWRYRVTGKPHDPLHDFVLWYALTSCIAMRRRSGYTYGLTNV